MKTDTPHAPASALVFEDQPDVPTREIMEFTLVYWDTSLKAAKRSHGRSLEKHQIRMSLSEQLENLWKINPDLRQLDPRREIQTALAKNFSRANTEFVPLVLKMWNLFCELDITLLRASEPRTIVTSKGDIDNRIKVLLDALRIPREGNEMRLESGESHPERIYCLLEDDDLVSRIRVTTDRLLTSADKENEICATIRVKIKGTSLESPWQFGR